MIERTFIIIVELIAALTAVAGTVTGRVLDESQMPMPFANVMLVNRADSAFVQGTTTGEDGRFALITDCNDCLLKITSVGYVTRFLESPGNSIGDIVMQPDVTLLGELVVQGQRPIHKLGKEGLLTGVDGTILSKLGTAEDVLRNVPGVRSRVGSFRQGQAAHLHQQPPDARRQ